MPNTTTTQTPAPAKSATAEGRYTTLETFRRPYLERAWDCAEITIPSVLPREGQTSASKLPTPWQSMGARAVRNLASKTLMAALPPNQPFFRQRIDEILLKREQVTPEQKSDVEKALSTVENAVMADIEMTGDRVGVFEMIKHLIVAGNVLVQESKLGLRVFPLSHYVVRRDPAGNALEIIVAEQIDAAVLPEGFLATLQSHEEIKQKLDTDKPITLYTRIVRTNTNWEVYQEVFTVRVPGSEGTYPLEENPWLPLRFTRIDGEDYGRSYVEEYLGDLRALEDLSQSLTEGAKAAAKMLVFVNPNGTTRTKTVAEAQNGAVVAGNAADVSVLQMEKFHDFQVAEKQARVIEERLAFAFLMHTSIQRNAERVTAEEIRFMAQELESTLGGFYTVFAQEFQLPYVRVKMARLQKANRLPQLPKGIVRPSIVTGIEALGRGNDRVKLTAYLRTLSETLGPEGAKELINGPEVAKRLATADGISTDNLIKTQEQIDTSRQQIIMAQMIEKLGPNVINQGGNLLKEGMAANGRQGTTAAGQS